MSGHEYDSLWRTGTEGMSRMDKEQDGEEVGGGRLKWEGAGNSTAKRQRCKQSSPVTSTELQPSPINYQPRL